MELWLEQELPVTKGRGQSHFLQGWGGSCMQARGVSSPWTLWKVGEVVDPNSRHNPGRQMGVLRLLYLFIQQTFTECPLCARHWSRCWWYTSNRKGKEKIPWFQGVDCQLISCKHLLIARHCSTCRGFSFGLSEVRTFVSVERGISGSQNQDVPLYAWGSGCTERSHNLPEVTQLAQAVRTQWTEECSPPSCNRILP